MIGRLVPQHKLDLRVLTLPTHSGLEDIVLGLPTRLKPLAMAVGAAGLILAAGVVWLGARSIHQLSRRWLVLVPTGMVLHDPLVMPEPQKRSSVTALARTS